MAVKMKVRKGDLVQVLAGKDRGKRGRVIEARPSERRVIVENLNVAKRHTRPRPVKDATRMGGTQIVPGGIIDKPAPIPVGNVMVVCPVCDTPIAVCGTSSALGVVPIASRTRTNWPGRSARSGLATCARAAIVPVARSTTLSRKTNLPL